MKKYMRGCCILNFFYAIILSYLVFLVVAACSAIPTSFYILFLFHIPYFSFQVLLVKLTNSHLLGHDPSSGFWRWYRIVGNFCWCKFSYKWMKTCKKNFRSFKFRTWPQCMRVHAFFSWTSTFIVASVKKKISCSFFVLSERLRNGIVWDRSYGEGISHL